MNTLAKIGIVATSIAILVAIVPAVKGPYNRIRNNVNEKLNSEFVVDNMKAEYVRLYNSRTELTAEIQKFDLERKVNAKKIENVAAQAEKAKEYLVKTGTSNLAAFQTAKDLYESKKVELANLQVLETTYSNTVARLQNALDTVNVNMSKAKTNIASLESKKTLVDSIKKVNAALGNIKGVNDVDLAVNVEKLDDDVLREAIKLEAMQEPSEGLSTKEEADAYIAGLK